MAIRIGDLLYVHLLDNGNLYTGRYFNQGDELGQMKPGSFSGNCGWANQGSGWFHVHWGFPDSGSFEAGGWTLSISDGLWRRGGETRGVYSWFQAEGGGSDTTDPDGDITSPSEGATITSRSVRLEGWGSDSGSGLARAHFTAYYGGSWRQVGPDFTSSPFGFDWDMCNGGVPNGQVTLGLDLWDKAGNEANSPRGNRHFTKNYDCSPPPPSLPSPPQLLSPANGSTFNEGDSITLSWSATGNEYYGEISGGPGGTLTFGWQSGTSKTIGSQWAGYTYSWRVKARNSAGESGWSNTWTFIVRPATPTGLSAQAVSCSQINLSWSDNSGNEEGYKVYRNGAYVGQAGMNATSYQDTGLSQSTTYTYYVKAYRGSTESLSSNTASATTPPCALPKPDLVPSQWEGWQYPIVPSSITGTTVVNTLYANRPTYIDWGISNIGNADCAGDAYGDLYIDSTRVAHYNFGNVQAGWTWAFFDWVETINAPGWHTLKFIADPDNLIAESDESNNVWEHQFYWESACADPYEPNDTFDQATSISPGIVYNAYVCSATDQDYYAFYAGMGDEIQADLYSLPDDYDLVLYNPSRDAVASSTNGGTADERVIYLADRNGYWYVHVYGWAGAYSLAGPYSLKVERIVPQYTPTPTATSSPPGEPVLIRTEAENLPLQAPMTVGNANDASGCRFVYSPVREAGLATFTFTLPRADTYQLWARGKGSDWSHNSFWVSLDGAEWIRWEITPTNWLWWNFGPYNLGPGVHTLEFKGREPDAQLDRLEIASDASYIPTVVPCEPSTPMLTATPTRTRTHTSTPTSTSTTTPTFTPIPTPTVTPTPPGSANLAPNPGFEVPNASSTGPLGWQGNQWAGPAPTYNWTTNVRHSGDRAVQIINHSDETRSRWRAPKVVVQPGQFYHYRVWVKGSRIAGTARLTMVFIKADGTRLGKKDSSVVRGTFGWQRLEGAVVPPPGTKYIRLELRLHGAGTVWFDDVLLERT
ncbi:MAG: CARDB domain-containing protein [Anaerolineae bacterium]